MEKLKAKLRKQGGFTLVEMLIVVAIIAILIAVSIPMVSTSLNDAKENVDAANLRSAILLGDLQVLTEGAPATDETWYYHVDDSKQGSLKDSDSGAVNGVSSANSTKHIEITIKTDGTVAGKWA